MIELNQIKKNRINLADYNSRQDIENRIVMSDFSPFDLEVLEEVLFSPLKISLRKLAKNLNTTDIATKQTLDKLAKTSLLSIEGDSVTVDKEMRKYFEFQIQRFSPQFKPDMEFVQGILKKVPIQFLPFWYSIPRTSNNIFESIVEKFLLTPQIFQRYLHELNFSDPIIGSIIKDLFSAPDFSIFSSDLIAKYNLSRYRFEEIMLLLEFSFVCTIRYQKEDDYWLEMVTPLHEWHEYHLFLKQTQTPLIKETDLICQQRKSHFSFIEDVSSILNSIRKCPLKIDSLSTLPIQTLSSICHFPLESSQDITFAQKYFSHLIEKIRLIKLAEFLDNRLYALDTAHDFLEMTLENRALHLYRHPLNRILSFSFPAGMDMERTVHEAEKSIKRVLHGNWVYFDEFIKGVIIPLNEESLVMLKRVGKQWKYTLPTYNETEIHLIKSILFEWLFECGVVSVGTCHGKDCFAVTPFGRLFFAD